MTITARKHALINRISPGAGQLIGLYLLELAVILSWTLLLDTVFNFLSGSWFILLPVSYFLSVTMLAWLERSSAGARVQCPLEAFGLAEMSLNGLRPTEWQTLRRLLFTPPLLILLCIGLIPVPGTGNNVLQIISGTKIVPLDTRMDPRHDSEIFSSRRKALMKVISYTMVSLMVSAIIVFAPPKPSDITSGGSITSVYNLPERERELLASYLEMKSMYPDSLEFHVRLASLYYRNNMEEDLLLELVEIRKIDPDHSILMLEQDLTVTMEDLITAQYSGYSDSLQEVPLEETLIPAADTSATDSAEPDSVSLDLRLIASDSTSLPEDSTLVPDTVPIMDSAPIPDTVSIEDSVQIPDTVPIEDSVQIPDTIPIEDSVQIVDTVPIPDSSDTDAYIESDSQNLQVVQDSIPEAEIEPMNDDVIPDDTPDSSISEDSESTESIPDTQLPPLESPSEPEGT